jgi:nucleoside-diphosphate-sugar epimerase
VKVLIAGGAGYIGSVLVPKLLQRGYDVTVVDLLWFGNHLPAEAQVWDRDLFDLSVDDLKGFDQVVFMAGLSNDPMAEYSPKENFVQNAAAPAYLAYIAKTAGVRRYIYASSCSVYGYTVDELYDEDSPTISGYPYGISKLQGENSVMGMVDDNFSVISLRQGTVSGVSPRMRFDLVVNTMFKSAVTNKEVTVNNPAIWRPILGIQDAVKAYIRSLEANFSISGVFNVASGNYTVGEIGDIVVQGVEELLNIKPKLTIKAMQDFRNYKVSYDRAMHVLSFKPTQDVRGIVEDLAAHEDEFGDYSDPNFYNIQVFRTLAEEK